MVKTSKNSISLEVFFSGQKTANGTFQGSPELHFGCKIQIQALGKHFVTKWPQNLKFKKWDQSGTWISKILHFSPKKFFQIFSGFYWKNPKIEGISEKFIACSLSQTPRMVLRHFSRQRNLQSKLRYYFPKINKISNFRESGKCLADFLYEAVGK